jgi:hypothetical protein
MKRPVFIIDTERKSKEQLKPEAREALRRFQQAGQPPNGPAAIR